MGGVSLTHGAPGARQHIWTFATGITEVDQSSVAEYLCPCSGFHPFVGNDYFFECGLNTAYSSQYVHVFQSDDPLWDGQNCRAGTTCCQFNTPPRFTRDLLSSTSGDIELCLCYINDNIHEDIALELIELYVQ